MSSHNLLRRLYRLDRYSSGFHDRLRSILYGKEFEQCAPNLQGEDLLWLIDYLDKVRHRMPLPRSLLKSV